MRYIGHYIVGANVKGTLGLEADGDRKRYVK